jgi:hypothetical protein
MASAGPFRGGAARLLGDGSWHDVRSPGGEVQEGEKYDSPALILSRGEHGYFIGEKAAGIRILFC